MPNAVRKWAPLVLIVAAFVASFAAYTQLPPVVRLDLPDLLPFGVSRSEPAGRWLVTLLLPTVSLVLWLLFRAAPTRGGQRFARRFVRWAPEEASSPAQFERFASTYDLIVLGIVGLILGIHGAMLAAVFGYTAAAARLFPLALGWMLIVVGNVMPRLRPNWVAGLRSKRVLSDPQLWRDVHRRFGAAFVISGIITAVVALIAPRYGVLTGITLLFLSCVVGFVASTRRTEMASSRT